MAGKLTAKQQMFVDEYLVDMNGTQAAIRAGYSPKTANEQAARLLANANVADAVNKAQARRAATTRIDAAWVLKRLAEEAEADVADLYTEDGKLKPIHEWPKIWRQGLVAGIDVEELMEGRGEDREQIGWVRKVKLSDRTRRLELIGRHIGVNAFQDVVQHKGLDELAERLERASKRLAKE